MLISRRLHLSRNRTYAQCLHLLAVFHHPIQTKILSCWIQFKAGTSSALMKKINISQCYLALDERARWVMQSCSEAAVPMTHTVPLHNTVSWLPTHLNMKMKSIRSMQKVATLSIVFISTTSWRRNAGMKRTSFSTRRSRNVLSTERPPSAWPIISQMLKSREAQEVGGTKQKTSEQTEENEELQC